jgi:hypothetical protein
MNFFFRHQQVFSFFAFGLAFRFNNDSFRFFLGTADRFFGNFSSVFYPFLKSYQ